MEKAEGRQTWTLLLMIKRLHPSGWGWNQLAYHVGAALTDHVCQSLSIFGRNYSTCLSEQFATQALVYLEGNHLRPACITPFFLATKYSVELTDDIANG